MTDQVTNEEVQTARERVDNLRSAIEAEKSRASAQATSNSNIVRKASLDAEAERLERELAALRVANDPANVAAQVEALTDQVAATNEEQVVDTSAPVLPPLPTDDGPADDDN